MGDESIRLPTGTVTFLRTDVEGSMVLARAGGDAWDDLNAVQQAIVQEAVAARGGVTVRTEGDAVFAVFPEAMAAVRAAVDLQEAMRDHAWPPWAAVAVRVGLHTGEAHLAGDDYGGFDVNRAARVAAVGHGGQIVVSEPTRALVQSDLPSGMTLRDLGRHALKDVPYPERLFQLDTPGLRRDFPPIRTGSAVTGNLPPRLTSFVARERELDELAALCDSARLVTITGPGGIGKTSLAIEVARAAVARFPEGAWLVQLDATEDALLVPTVIARSLGLHDGTGGPVTERLGRYLAERRSILVLDNFEHLLAAAPDIADLLRSTRDLRMVVTSRAPLHIGGEHEYPLGPLPGAAAELFVERARAVVPGWEPGEDAPIVDEICRLVDGLPLGIELAAARVALLPPAIIRDRLAARLALPGSGPRDAPARQRTLDATIAWSYDLLEPRRRRLVCELSVFDGGFDLEQVDPVGTIDGGEDPLDALAELVDHSLVARTVMTTSHAALGTVRFTMLETIRSFALRRLEETGDEREVRRRHALAMLDLAQAAAAHIPGADQVRWLDRLAQDHANLGAALGWAIEAGEVDLAQQLSWSTWRYWQLAGRIPEGRALADAVVAMPRADEPSPGRMWSLAAAAGLAYWQADMPRADLLYHAELETAHQIGDRTGEADAHFNLAATRSIGGDQAGAARYLSLARDAYRELGDTVGFARTDWGIANLTMIDGRVTEALEMVMEARRQFSATGDVMYESLALGSIAFLHLRLGNRREAITNGITGLLLTHALRDVATTTIGLADGAVLLAAGGRHEDAAVTNAAYRALSDIHGVQPPAGIGQLILETDVDEGTLARLNSDTYAAAIRRGGAMSLDEAVAFLVDALLRSIDEPPASERPSSSE